jgi:channel protein (hemolysin III family)
MVATVVSRIGAIPGFCDPVCSLSHLVAAIAAGVAAVPLIRLGRGSRARIVAIAIYVSCVVAVLGVSGTYHSLDHGATRAMMRHLDYFSIWLLIAGTFTAVHGIMCRGFWRSGVLAFIWIYAAMGIVLQILWFKVFSGVPGLILYLGLGWVGIGSVFKLGRQIGFRAVRPIWYAGIFFSAGAVLEAMRQPVLVQNWVGPHEIFHLAVVAGVIIHWVFIRRLLLTHLPAAVVPVPAVIPSLG